MLADHATPIARTGPLRQRAIPLFGGSDKALKDLIELPGINEREKRKRGSEGVPDADVSIENAVMNLPIVGTVVNRFSRGIQFKHPLWKHQGMIEAAVKRFIPPRIRFDFHPAKAAATR